MSDDALRLGYFIRSGRFAEAEQWIRQGLAKEPDDAMLHLDLSRVLCRLERPKEAEEAARRAIGLTPDWGFPHQVLAEALLLSARLKEAEAALWQAIALDGDDADPRALLARVEMERDRHERSLEHAEAGLAFDPDHDVCRFYRILALGKTGKHEQADEAALGLLADDPDDAANHSARGWIMLERNAVPEARMHFQEALRLDPDNEDARFGLARCLQQGNPVLGWFLRLVVSLDRIPMVPLIVGAILLGFVLPDFLRKPARPESVQVLGAILKACVLGFFVCGMAARPIFDCTLAISREGRNALGPREMRAVKWCAGLLLAGLVYLGIWIFRGTKGTLPPDAIGLMAAAVLLYEALTLVQPWVRRRMLALAGIACAAALWFCVGPPFVMRPLAKDLAKALVALKVEGPGQEASAAELKARMENLFKMHSRAFLYPAILMMMLASYSDEIIAALKRRAPDEPDEA